MYEYRADVPHNPAAYPMQNGGNRNAMSMVDRNLVIRSYDFAFDLQKHLLKPETQLAFSPASIYLALSMMYMGASGQTKRQIGDKLYGRGTENNEIGVNSQLADLQKTLNAGHKQDFESGLSVNSANRLFLQKTVQVKSSYRHKLASQFHSDVQLVDFQQNTEKVRQTINHWVSSQTNGAISNMIEPQQLRADTIMALVNALYFNGRWRDPFRSPQTSVQPFYFSTKVVRHLAMRQISYFRYAENGDFQMLLLPYRGDGQYNMVLILPRAKNGLSAVLAKLNGQLFKTTLEAAKEVKVDVQIPKDKFESSFDAKDILAKMDISDMFSPKAQFTGISDQHLFVSKVLHKSAININEDGTQAVAATSVSFMTGMGPPGQKEEVKSFVADHPFMAAIVGGRWNHILFLGVIQRPTAATETNRQQSFGQFQ